MIGGQGKSVAAAVDIPVTTGNALTAITACETVELLRQRLGGRRKLYLLGPPGPVANAILEVLVSRGHRLTVVSPRTPKPLHRLVERLNNEHHGHAMMCDSVDAALGPDSILIAASSTGGRLRLSQLPTESVVVDVAEPLDVEREMRRRDVLVLEGEYLRPPQSRVASGENGLITSQSRHIYTVCGTDSSSLADRHELCSVGRKVPSGLRELQN